MIGRFRLELMLVSEGSGILSLSLFLLTVRLSTFCDLCPLEFHPLPKDSERLHPLKQSRCAFSFWL